MKKIVLIALYLFLGFKFSNISAQIDTSFWFAAPWVTPDHTERHNIVVHISTFSAPSTTVHLHQPAAIAPNKYDTIFVLGPNQTFDYIFWRDKLASFLNVGFDSLETRPANTVVPYGLHISSSSSITVVYDVITSPPGYNNSETFSLKGQNALGMEFVCPQQTLYRNRFLSDRFNTPPGVMQPKQQICIVATASNTVVWITPKCNVVGHAANVTYSVLLPNAGSSYNIENTVSDTYVSGQSLSGTLITADKPVAVTVADDSINNVHSNPAGIGLSLWGGMGCYDLIGDQIVPVAVVGQDYVVNRGQLYKENQLGAGNPGMKESAFIVAAENSTQLTIVAGTTTLSASINKGDTYVDTLTTDLTYIHADKNVYVYHVSGIGCELGAALLPPLECAGSKLVSFSRNTPQLFALNILCKNGSQSTFTLNGSTSLIPAAAFTIVPGTALLLGGPYYGAQISLASTTILPIGSYTIGNSTDEFALGVFDGHFTSGGLYHYMTSFMNRVYVKTNTLSPVCIGTSNTVALTGTVSGANTTGLWTSANGTGTFSSYSSSNTIISTIYTLSPADTSQNTLKFYLTSVGNCKPVKDSVSIQLNHKPGIQISANVTMCKSNIIPVVLSGSVINATGGQWSGGNGGFFSPPGLNTNYILSSLDTMQSNIVLTLSSQGPLTGCSNSSKSLTITLLNPPSVSAGSGSVVCGKTIPGIALNGSVTGITTTGLWASSGTGTFLPSPGALSGTYLFSSADLLSGAIVFTLLSTNNGFCSGVNDVVTILRDTASVSIHSPTNALCGVQSLCLSATGAQSYVWSSGNIGSGVIVTPTLSATYTVTGTTSLNCNYTNTITISVHPLPTVTAVAERSLICIGETSTLSPDGASTYTWINSFFPSTPVVVSPQVTTSYTVIGKNSLGCTDTATVQVLVDMCTGLSNSKNETSRVSVFPNPNSGTFFISSEIDLDLKLVNESGQIIGRIKLGAENAHTAEVRGLAKGIYFLLDENNLIKIHQKISVSE